MRSGKWWLVALAFALMASGCAGDDKEPPSVLPTLFPSPAPEPADGSVRFVVLGDYGTGASAQAEVANRLCNWRRDHPFDLIITTGDNIYETGHSSRFEVAFFEPYACLIESGVRFRATLGNHDIVTNDGRPELNEPALGMKARNYVIRKGGVRFVMVDSNRLRPGWIEKHLVPKAGDRWTVVVFHHPVYSTGAHGSTPGFRPTLPRLFEKYDVDLVLNGHEHSYEVTKKLKGIRYVITGGGGASLRPCGSPAWFTDRCASRHHFLYVKAAKERLTIKAVGIRGRPFHVFRTRGR